MILNSGNLGNFNNNTLRGPVSYYEINTNKDTNIRKYQKKVKHSERKLCPDLGPNIFIKKIQANRLGKDIITLPFHGDKTNQAITNSLFLPHIILCYH